LRGDTQAVKGDGLKQQLFFPQSRTKFGLAKKNASAFFSGERKKRSREQSEQSSDVQLKTRFSDSI